MPDEVQSIESHMALDNVNKLKQIPGGDVRGVKFPDDVTRHFRDLKVSAAPRVHAKVLRAWFVVRVMIWLRAPPRNTHTAKQYAGVSGRLWTLVKGRLNPIKTGAICRGGFLQQHGRGVGHACVWV